MFEEYSKLKSVYFVVEKEGKFWVVLVLHHLKMKPKQSRTSNVFFTRKRSWNWEPNDGNLFAKCKDFALKMLFRNDAVYA
jgi:hypothetical protein